LWTGTRILIKSARYSIILTIINLILSAVISMIFSGGIETSQIAGNLGNLTLLESVILIFLSAPASLYNTASRQDRYEGEESDEEVKNKQGDDYTVARLPDGHGGWFVGLIGKRRAVPYEGDNSNVERALTFISWGVMLLLETVVLARITGY